MSAALPRPGDRRVAELRRYLERMRERYNRADLVGTDPLCVALAAPAGPEREISGLLAAWLASGRARSIIDSAQRLVDRLSNGGAEPLAEVVELPYEELLARIDGFRYRWVDAPALAATVAALGEQTRGHGSPVQALSGHDDGAASLMTAVAAFATRIEERSLAMLPADAASSARAVRWLLANPTRGGAAKRWMMWLRWFVRRDEVDPGGHEHLGAGRLVVPLDTHVFRLSRFLGLTDRRTAGGPAALEITEALSRVAPGDPLRYDFALSRIGILGHCPSRRRESVCSTCTLYEVCRA